MGIAVKKIPLGLAFGLLLWVVAVQPANAGQAVNKNDSGVAIMGYDPVAYFTEGRPVEGSAEFEHEWYDATWRFAKAEHRDRFASDPEAYAPRYGGFCAGAMSRGWTLPIDPEAWVIVDGRLYLNFSEQGRDDLAADPEPTIARADANWERLGSTD